MTGDLCGLSHPPPRRLEPLVQPVHLHLHALRGAETLDRTADAVASRVDEAAVVGAAKGVDERVRSSERCGGRRHLVETPVQSVKKKTEMSSARESPEELALCARIVLPALQTVAVRGAVDVLVAVAERLAVDRSEDRRVVLLVQRFGCGRRPRL